MVIASHRQDRTFQPADDRCPLCPSSAGSRTEIPAPEYEVAVFETGMGAFANDITPETAAARLRQLG